MRLIMTIADNANAYINEQAPWQLAKEEGQEAKVQAVCTTALNVFRLLVLYLKPVLPVLAEKAEAFLNVAPLTWADAAHTLTEHKLNPFKPLMQRVDKKKIDAKIGRASCREKVKVAGVEDHICINDAHYTECNG